MPTDEEKNQVFRTISELKKDISELRNQLNAIDEQKEALFKQKEEQSSQITSAISDVRELKNKRNEYIGTIKKEKDNRKVILDELTKKIAEAKAMQQTKEVKPAAVAPQQQFSGDRRRGGFRDNSPGGIARQIEELEMKIQTDVMSFDKEKQLMKQIKDFKKKLEQMRGTMAALEDKKKLSKDIEKLKKDANSKHAEIQDLAKKSQEKHEEMLAKSKLIDELKVKEEEAFKSFIEQKTKFNEINEKLKEKLSELNKLDQETKEIRKERESTRKETIEKKLETKEKEVEEKIKHKRKLTTEDLLVFQGKDQGE